MVPITSLDKHLAAIETDSKLHNYSIKNSSWCLYMVAATASPSEYKQ